MDVKRQSIAASSKRAFTPAHGRPTCACVAERRTRCFRGGGGDADGVAVLPALLLPRASAAASAAVSSLDLQRALLLSELCSPVLEPNLKKRIFVWDERKDPLNVSLATERSAMTSDISLTPMCLLVRVLN